MRVFQYAHTEAGGHLRYTNELAQGVAALGVETVIVTSSCELETTASIESVLRAPSSGRSGAGWLFDRVTTYVAQLWALAKLARRLKLGDEDVFHFQELPSLLPSLAPRIIASRGARVVLTVHNIEPHDGSGLISRIIVARHRRLWRRFDALIVHSDDLRNELLRATPQIEAGRVHAIPHPVWAEESHSAEPAHRDYLLFGALRRNKGIESFLAALAALGDPPATIAGHGDAEYMAHLRAMARDLKLEHCALSFGYVDDAEISKMFAAHRVVVLPYRQFGAQSGVLNLSVAFDRPVVVTDVGALAETVRAFDIGTIAPGDGIDDLASAMDECLSQAAADQFGAKLAGMRETLSVSHVASSHVSVYTNL